MEKLTDNKISNLTAVGRRIEVKMTTFEKRSFAVNQGRIAVKDEKTGNGNGKTYGYVRVSKRTQNEDRQLFALQDECDKIFIEKISAVAKKRPEFEKVMAILKPADTFLILDLDRAFRSTVEAIQTAEMLRERGIHFKIKNANIDTSSEFGEIIFGILALLAQFERKVIIRRTNEGLDAARKRGVRLGRPFALTNSQVRRAYRQVDEKNQPVYKVAKRFGVSHSTLALAFQRLRLVV